MNDAWPRLPLQGHHADDLAAVPQRRHDQRCRGSGRSPTWHDARIGQLVGDELRLAVFEDPARDAEIIGQDPRLHVCVGVQAASND